MEPVTIEQIDERLAELPSDKLRVVYSFVTSLLDGTPPEENYAAFQTMLASEEVLRRDWNRPEEDEAWADL